MNRKPKHNRETRQNSRSKCASRLLNVIAIPSLKPSPVNVPRYYSRFSLYLSLLDTMFRVVGFYQSRRRLYVRRILGPVGWWRSRNLKHLLRVCGCLPHNGFRSTPMAVFLQAQVPLREVCRWAFAVDARKGFRNKELRLSGCFENSSLFFHDSCTPFIRVLRGWLRYHVHTLDRKPSMVERLIPGAWQARRFS